MMLIRILETLLLVVASIFLLDMIVVAIAYRINRYLRK
jgi:hypothetical protein